MGWVSIVGGVSTDGWGQCSGWVSTDVTFRQVLLTAPQEGSDLSQS